MGFSTVEDADDSLMEIKENYRNARDKGKKCCTVVDGIALGCILENRERSLKYLAIMKDCESVICCRVTPKQKAQVVRLVKKNLGKIALAIGDGANDVNMIQEGDIGVGIFGLEGMQAANASDFAIPEFKALEKLLFVHGRWSYIRNAEMILYFFYKNMLFTIPQFYFVFFNAYSGRSLFDDWYMSFYNMIFTAFPLGAKAIFDQDVHYLNFEKNGSGERRLVQNDKIREMIPYLYKVGQNDTIFNNVNFLYWITKGIVHGFLIWLITLYSIHNGKPTGTEGYESDFWLMSLTMFTAIFLIATLQITFMIMYWTWFNVFAIIVMSILSYFAWMFVADGIGSLNAAHSTDVIWGSSLFYLIIFVNIGWFVLYYYSEYFINEWMGSNVTITARKLVKMGVIKTLTVDEVEQIFDDNYSAKNKIKQREAVSTGTARA